MGLLVVTIILGFIGFSVTQDLTVNIRNTKMVMNVLKTFDALYDEFQRPFYHEASTDINYDKSQCANEPSSLVQNVDNLPERTKNVRNLRLERFFKDITNDATPTSFTSMYIALEVKFWALEYAFLFKLCHQYATTTEESTGTLADDCLRMSNIMNVFGLENIEPIINRTKDVEKGQFDWILRENMFDVYTKFALAMKNIFDQNNESVDDESEFEEVNRKLTNLRFENDDSAYSSIIRDESNIQIQRQIALIKIFFKWINCRFGYSTYLKINPKLPELDTLRPTWLMAGILFEKFTADNPDKQHPYFEFGPSNYQMMYRNIVVDLIRTLKLNEFRSELNIFLANDNSGNMHVTDLDVREQVIVKYVESIEFGSRYCYLTLDRFKLHDFRYQMFAYDSVPKYLIIPHRVSEKSNGVCEEPSTYRSFDFCSIWQDAKKSFVHALQPMDFSRDNAMLAILTDPQMQEYFDTEN